MEKLWLSRENRAVFCLKTGINTSPLHERKKKNPMGEHPQAGRYLLRFAAQIFRSATVLHASLSAPKMGGGIGRSGDRSDAAVRSAMVSLPSHLLSVLCGVSSSCSRNAILRS